MLPEQVSTNWDRIAPLIELSMPPLIKGGRRSMMSNVLRSVLLEELVVWMLYRGTEERAVISTLPQVDAVLLGKTLLIYSFTALKQDLTQREALKVFMTLDKYARSLGCDSIVAYSDLPQVVEFLRRHGADTSFNFITFAL